MPRGDRTGPMRMGPMAGRGVGICAGFKTPGYLKAGRGFSFGRGYRRMLWAAGLIPGCAYLTYRWINRGETK
jgi:hypothetical protein